MNRIERAIAAAQSPLKVPEAAARETLDAAAEIYDGSGSWTMALTAAARRVAARYGTMPGPVLLAVARLKGAEPRKH